MPTYVVFRCAFMQPAQVLGTVEAGNSHDGLTLAQALYGRASSLAVVDYLRVRSDTQDAADNRDIDADIAEYYASARSWT